MADWITRDEADPGPFDPTDPYDAAIISRHQRRYRSDLRAAPDCRDPDHPGCELCEPMEEDPDAN